MSWQPYVDNLTGTGKVDKAALLGRAGDVWAIAPGFSPSADEIAVIVKGFDDVDSLYSTGLKVEGEKYIVIRADDESIQGKKGEDGVVAVRTAQTIILTHYKGENNPAALTDALKAVYGISDHLKKSGF